MKVLLFANTAWYLYNFRLPLAQALRAQGAEVVLLAPPDDYVPRLQAEGFRWLSAPLDRRGMNPWREAATVAALARLYRRERPDLVHHFTVKPVLYGSLAARLTGLPRVVNAVTGLGYLFTGGGAQRRALRALAEASYRSLVRPTWVVFQNEDDRAYFLSRALAHPARTALIPSSGVDLARFQPQPEPDGEPVAMLAARLLWDKGVGEFVEAAKRLQRRGVRARFVLVGEPYDGNPSAVPRAQLQEWETDGLVEWWGWRDDMPAVLAQSHVVCLPSYREGLPKTLIEAAALGRPVVTTDAPGCRDAVRDGETGLLVPVRDAAALADALERLLTNPGLRQKMGQAGRRFAARFSVAQVVADTLAVYRRTGLSL